MPASRFGARTGALPGAAPPGVPAGTLRLFAAVAADFPGDSPLARDPDLRALTADLARPYGGTLDEAALRGGRGQSYADMAELLVRRLVDEDRPVGLLVLVYATPDVRPGRAVAVHLSEVCPGRPLAFALCDEGAAGGFSALRIADAYGRTGGADRVLLVTVEQAQLHHVPHRPARLADRHSAAALLYERGGQDTGMALAAVRERGGVGGDRVGAELGRLVAGLPPDTLLVLGPGLAGVPAPETELDTAAVRRARERNPYTGGWAALARALPDARRQGLPLALADWEPENGRLDLVHWEPA